MERDLVVLGGDLNRVASSVRALARELTRERKNGSLSITKGHSPDTAKESDWPAEPGLPFPEDPWS